MKRSLTALACAAALVVVTPTAAHAAIKGNNKANVLTGGPQNNTIYGYGGSDTIRGLGGDDRLYPGTGQHDRVYGGAGADEIVAPTDLATGAQLYGQRGWDVIMVGKYDYAYGGNGGDLLTVVYMSVLKGGRGPDHLIARGSGTRYGRAWSRHNRRQEGPRDRVPQGWAA